MHKFLLTLYIVAGSLLSVPGQQAMSLQQCIDQALIEHPDIRLANLAIRDADWQIKENAAIAYPQIGLGINLSHYLIIPALPADALGFGEPGTKLRFALRNNFGGSVTLNQLLVNFSYFKTMRAAREYRSLVQLQMAAVREKVANGVRDAYLPALLITESVEVLDRNIANQEKLLQDTRATFEAGFVEQLDVDRLELVLTTLRTERDNLDRQRDILIDALKFAMGFPIRQELTLSDDMDALLADMADVNPAEDIDYMKRPDYQVILKARELTQIQIDAARNAWKPVVNAFAAYNPSFQGNEKLFWIPAATVGLQVSMPIFDGGLNRARRERAIIEALEVEEQTKQLVNGLNLEVESARKQLANAQFKLADQETNLALAEKIYTTTDTKFRSGIASSFEVTQAQSAYYQAQSAMINARYEYLAAIMKWRQALGTF